MKRLLIVSYFYPPNPLVGGLRPARLARHLPALGWDPTVLTVRLPGVERREKYIIETGYRDVLSEWKRRLGLNSNNGFHEQLGLPLSTKPNCRPFHSHVVEWGKTLLGFPDAMKGWIPFAREAIDRLAGAGIDAIISTSPPISCHLIAANAKEKLRCHWIADFRDLWEGGLITRLYQRHALRAADALVTVSGPLAEELQRKIPNKPVLSIHNSFEPEEIPVDSRPSASQFTITYTGTLYKGKRDPTLVLETIKTLIENGILPAEDVRVRFYGPAEPFLTALIHKLGLEWVVTTHDLVSHEQALKLQAESQLLLFLDWSGPAANGIYTSKIFEYLAMGRPIVAFGPDDRSVVADLVRDSSAGVFLTSKDGLQQFLITSYAQWRRLGFVPWEGKRTVIDRFTSGAMAKNFANILNGIVEQQVSTASEALQYGN